MNTSVNGQAPTALASREAYRKLVQRGSSKRSWLVRMVVTLLYLELCRKCRAVAEQYWIFRLCCPRALAMLPRESSPSVRLYAVVALSASQSCSKPALQE